jgi:anaerobic selenocysteine-containing dehydrogenase
MPKDRHEVVKKEETHMDPVKTVKTICALCTDHCGIDVKVQDGKIIRVSRPIRSF